MPEQKTSAHRAGNPYRRSFFARSLGNVTTAMMGLGFAELLAEETPGTKSLLTGPHFPAKAKRVLQIFCPGAASHVDLWEHKPELEKRDGEPLPGEENFLKIGRAHV